VFYYIDPSGVGWALPPVTSQHPGEPELARVHGRR
jgi:hypothetical protein